MEKDMETSTFFSVFQLMKFMQYQSMKRMEKMDLKPSQAGVLFSLKHWGGTVAETTGRTCRHYTTIHDCCVTEDGRKRICDTKTG